MKRLKHPLSTYLLLAIAGILAIVLSGCATTDRVVIDGDAAIRMANAINEQLHDPEESLRGNSASNMRNGGYLYTDSRNLWFIVAMEFEDGTSEHYLQHLFASQIGSLTAGNDIIAPLRGTIVGVWDNLLIYIDRDNQNRLSYIDLDTFTQESLFNIPVTHAHLMGEKIYLSTEGMGDLHELALSRGVGGAPRARSALLFSGGGQLATVAGGVAYMLGSTEGSSVIRRIDLETRSIAGKIVGGPFRNLQIAGSWLFYQDGTKLMRQMLGGTRAVLATQQEVAEYAVWGNWLAVTSPEGGICVGHLDGTGIVRIAEDRASGLQLIDNKIFYRNAHDGNAIYVIDLVEGKRSSLIGVTLTDGGVRFVPATVKDERLDQFVGSVAQKRSTNDQYWGAPGGPIIFAEVARDGSITYHRHVDDKDPIERPASVVVVATDTELLGQYTDGGLAYRLDRKLTLFSMDDQTPLLTLVVEGRPPSLIKSGAGDREGLPLPWHQKALNLRYLILTHGTQF